MVHGFTGFIKHFDFQQIPVAQKTAAVSPVAAFSSARFSARQPTPRVVCASVTTAADQSTVHYRAVQ
jgi:hypothetical protein